jgi:hypothetical protein
MARGRDVRSESFAELVGEDCPRMQRRLFAYLASLLRRAPPVLHGAPRARSQFPVFITVREEGGHSVEEEWYHYGKGRGIAWESEVIEALYGTAKFRRKRDRLRARLRQLAKALNDRLRDRDVDVRVIRTRRGRICLWQTGKAPSRAVRKRSRQRTGPAKQIPSLSDCVEFLRWLEYRRVRDNKQPLRSLTVSRQWHLAGGRPTTLRRALRACKARHYRESFSGPWFVDLNELTDIVSAHLGL